MSGEIRFCRFLPNEAASAGMGAALWDAIAGVGFGSPTGLFVALEGDLGAGKTTLVRGLLRGAGVTGAVRSPTYTLVESYDTPLGPVHHLDWYRLADAGEVEAIGFRDLQPGALVLVEWPDRAPSIATGVDLVISLVEEGEGRRIEVQTRSVAGQAVVGLLQENIQNNSLTSSFP